MVWKCLVPWCRSRAISCCSDVAEAQLQDKTLKGNTNVNGKLVDTNEVLRKKIAEIGDFRGGGLSGLKDPDYPACSQAA